MDKAWKKNITLFLTGQIVSLFGSSLVQCALSWYITLETQSGVMMTIAIICGFLPTFLVAPFAGVWADRYDRKKLIIIADTVVGAATLGLAAAFFFGLRDIRLIFGVMAIRGLGQGIQQPAVNALVPTLVPEEMLMRVNSINSAAQSAMMLLSPALAGALMSLAPMESIFFIDVVTAVLAISVLGLFVRSNKARPAREAGAAGYFTDLKLGLSYVVRHKVVRLLFAFNSVLIILSAPAAMLCGLQVTRVFGADAWRLSFMDIGFTIGMTLGSVYMAMRGGFFKNRHSTISLGNYIFAVTTIMFGFISNYWLFVAVTMICGTALPMFTTPLTVLMQETVQPEYMGRVFSFNSMIMSLGMPLGLVLFGPLADIIGLGRLFIASGIVQLIISVMFMLSKKLRTAGHPRPAALKPKPDALYD